MGELPNYKEGTILDGNTRVIVTDTGVPPERLKEGVDYDIVVTIEEMFAIEEDARTRYMERYGVDPANPKVDVINGVPLPKEEVERLVRFGIIPIDG